MKIKGREESETKVYSLGLLFRNRRMKGRKKKTDFQRHAGIKAGSKLSKKEYQPTYMDHEALPHCLRRRPHRLGEHMPAVRRCATARRECFGLRPEHAICHLLQPDQLGEWNVTVAID